MDRDLDPYIFLKLPLHQSHRANLLATHNTCSDRLVSLIIRIEREKMASKSEGKMQSKFDAIRDSRLENPEH